MFALAKPNLLCNPLETGECFGCFNAVEFRHPQQKGRGHNRARHKGIIGHAALSNALLEHVIHKQGGGFVAIQEHQLTHVVAHSNAHSVAVGVAADDHVVSQLFCPGECKLQGRRLFRVRGMDS